MSAHEPRSTRQTRPQSAAEERANSLSHGIGCVLAALALPLLVQLSVAQRSPVLHSIAVALFAAALMLLYLASALFHGLPPGRARCWFESLDHAAIYLVIAASYTPFAALALHGEHAWWALVGVWCLAWAGVAVTLFKWVTHRLVSTGLYVALGWLVLVAALPWIAQLSARGATLLLAGGVVYTLGAALFLLGGRWRYAHLVWHLCVMAGSALHGAAMVQNS